MSTLALYTISARLDRYGFDTVNVVAPSAALALAEGSARSFIVGEAVDVRVVRSADAYCGHMCGYREDGPEGPWRCEDCREVFPDDDAVWDATARNSAFEAYCARIVLQSTTEYDSNVRDSVLTLEVV